MITQPQCFAAFCRLLMVLLAVLWPAFVPAQQNECIESGPHYGAWNCYNNPSFSGNSISPSTICVERVPGTPVTLPDPTDVVWTFTEPLRYRYLTYDCSETTMEQETVICASSFWYYDPPPPTDPSPGTYTSDIKIDYWSGDADCPMAQTTYTIGTVTWIVEQATDSEDFCNRSAAMRRKTSELSWRIFGAGIGWGRSQQDANEDSLSI